MNAQIFSHEQLIGTTTLKVGDVSMGCLFGDITPTDNYYKHIQKTVWLLNVILKKNNFRWQSLNISVQLDNGCFIFAQGGFTIDDTRELTGEPIRIDIAGVDRFIIEDFFLAVESKPFLLEPWETISIGQKVMFEEELSREIDNHPLTGFEAIAICKFGPSDDVLFRINKQDSEKQFAIVHLTWKRKKELPGFPFTRFFNSFDDFKRSRMYPDNDEWM